MSTRCSELYLTVVAKNLRDDHSFHIYHEAFSGEYYIVDDFNRKPIRLTKKTAQEIVQKYAECQR